MFNICNVLNDNVDYEKQNNRFQRVRNSNVGIGIIKYLKDKLKYLDIEIVSGPATNIINLMQYGLLEGWCWEATESAIVFMKDEDYIERGILKLTDDREYFHSWICFSYNEQEYVLDLCLNILCKKEIYHKVFEARVDGVVTAHQVRNELIEQIKNPVVEKREEFDKFKKYIESQESDEARTILQKEVVCHGKEDITHPLFKNGAGYIADIEGQKIKTLLAHFYINA